MKESSKQSLSILIITLFVAGSFFIFFDMVKPGLAKMKAAIAEKQNQETNIKILQDYQAKSDAIIQRYFEISNQIATINMTLPTEARPAELLSILDVIARTKGVNLTNVVFKEIKPVVEETNVISESQEGTTSVQAIDLESIKPSILQVNLSFVTSYENFKAFLTEIEKERRLMDSLVVNLAPMALTASATSKTPSASNIFNYTLTLNAYFQPVNQIKN